MFLRKFYAFALVALTIGGFTALTAGEAMAQATATGTANINALINNPIQITKNQDLDFATAAPSTGATTVVVTPAGATTGSTAIGMSGAVSAAQFAVTGLANQAITILLPASVTIDDGVAAPNTSTMTVDGFGHDAGASPSIPAAGPLTINIGATLNIGAEQTAGTYTGSFDVDVNYN
jgi:hypothetical protein